MHSQARNFIRSSKEIVQIVVNKGIKPETVETQQQVVINQILIRLTVKIKVNINQNLLITINLKVEITPVKMGK
jgi:hypothetical protein